MKRQRKYKGFKLNHNGSPSKFNKTSSKNQATSSPILTVVKTICSIHTRRVGAQVSRAEKNALAITLREIFAEAAQTGALFVVLDSGDLAFKIDTGWFFSGANPQTALENILCFSSVNKKSLNAAISQGIGKIFGGAA
jgi:hypothetical protein